MPNKPPSPIRLSQELHAHLQEFCTRTTRHPPQVVREIIRMFFADGFDAADRRLKAGRWELPDGKVSPSEPPDMKDWSAEEQAEWYATGKEPQRFAKKKKKRKGDVA